jgi:hypothetical protein
MGKRDEAKVMHMNDKAKLRQILLLSPLPLQCWQVSTTLSKHTKAKQGLSKSFSERSGGGKFILLMYVRSTLYILVA